MNGADGQDFSGGIRVNAIAGAELVSHVFRPQVRKVCGCAPGFVGRTHQYLWEGKVVRHHLEVDVGIGVKPVGTNRPKFPRSTEDGRDFKRELIPIVPGPQSGTYANIYELIQAGDLIWNVQAKKTRGIIEGVRRHVIASDDGWRDGPILPGKA